MEGFLEQILEVVAIIIKTFWVGFILLIEGGYTILYKREIWRYSYDKLWNGNIITTAEKMNWCKFVNFSN